VDILPADLTDDADLAAVERRAAAGDVALLLNNAGMSVGGRLLDTEATAIDAMVRLNVVAPTRLATAAGRAMAARSQGAIINVGSVLALIPDFFNGVYTGTKAYVLSLSESLHKELSPLGVRVQAVLPGITRTPMTTRGGASVPGIPPEMVMEADDLVDAALAGFDMGEIVTVPSLPEAAQLDAYFAARGALRPNLSRSRPAERYRAA
jgi:short-subunit dehydrogenase